MTGVAIHRPGMQIGDSWSDRGKRQIEFLFWFMYKHLYQAVKDER